MSKREVLDAYVSVNDFERAALNKLPKAVRDYYSSGSDDEYTLRRNVCALRHYIIRPKVLVDVNRLDASVRICLHGPEGVENVSRRFEVTLPYPIMIAPSAFHCMAHPEGELATVKGAGESSTLMVCSTLSTTPLESIAKSAPTGTHLWYQLYVYKDRELTESLVKRAISAGYSALVLTVDAPTMGRRRADELNGFELPPHLRMANFDETLFAKTHVGEVGASGFSKYTLSLFDMSLSWRDLEWLVRISTIPVIVKGVMRADDAKKALECGAAGIIVSNHGGRQLDHCAATIEALPEVVHAVNCQCPVFVDGGFRSGADIFKAVAMGADAVLIGRPIVYGLAVGGIEGVKKVIDLLRTEFDYALRLSGCATISQLKSDSSMVVHENYYASKI